MKPFKSKWWAVFTAVLALPLAGGVQAQQPGGPVTGSVRGTVDVAAEAAADVNVMLAANLRRLAQQINSTIGNARDDVAQARRALAAKLEQAANAAEAVKGAAADKVADKIHGAKRVLARTLHEAGQAAENVDRRVNNIAGRANQFANNKVDFVEARLVRALHETADRVENTIDATQETAARAEARLMATAAHLEDVAYDFAGFAKEKAGDVYAITAAKLRFAAQMVDRTVDATTGEVREARQFLANKLRAAARAADAVRDAAADKVRDAKQGLARSLHEAAQAANAVHDKVDTVAEEAGQTARNLANSANSTVNNTAERAARKVASIEQRLAQTLEQTAVSVEATIGATANAAANVAGNAANVAANAAASANAQIMASVAQVENAAAAFSAQLGGSVANAAQAGVHGATNAAVEATLNNRGLQAGVDGAVNASTEILLRGTIHEAFAQPIVSSNTLQAVTDIAPPQPLQQQVSAAASGAARGMAFIDGYWSFNSVDGKYEWVSGILRRSPPGHHWMPGQWVKLENGFARIPGAWISDKVGKPIEVSNVPAVSKLAPEGVRPGADQFWVPGSFKIENGEAVQSAGHWARAAANTAHWVWNPAHFIPTVNGAILVDGYWDFALGDRGVLFAPLRFDNTLDAQAAGRLASAVMLHAPKTFLHLFVDPKTQQYLFGNFYGDLAGGSGLMSWVDFAKSGQGFDALFQHYDRLYAAAGSDLAARLQGWNRHFLTNPMFGPPRNLVELSHYLSSRDQFQAANVLVARIDPAAARELAMAGFDGRQLASMNAALDRANATVSGFGQETLNGSVTRTPGINRGVGGVGGQVGSTIGGAGGIGGTIGGVGGTLNGTLGGVGGIGGSVGSGLGGLSGGLGGGLGGTAGGTLGGIGGVGGVGAGGVGGIGGTGGVGGIVK